MYNLQSTKATIENDSPILQLRIDYDTRDKMTSNPDTIDKGCGIVNITKLGDTEFGLEFISRDFMDNYYSKSVTIAAISDDYVKYSVKNANDYTYVLDASGLLFTVATPVHANDTKYFILESDSLFFIVDWNKLSNQSYNVWGFNITFPRSSQDLHTDIICKDDTGELLHIPCKYPTILKSSDTFNILSDGNHLEFIYQTPSVQTADTMHITAINGIPITSPNITLKCALSDAVIVDKPSVDQIPTYPVFANLFSLNIDDIVE